MINVPVSEFRDSIDHLYRLVNVDYHACVGVQELRYWAERTERVLSQVSELSCKRAKPDDIANHTKSLEAAHRRLEQVGSKINELDPPKSNVLYITQYIH